MTAYSWKILYLYCREFGDIIFYCRDLGNIESWHQRLGYIGSLWQRVGDIGKYCKMNAHSGKILNPNYREIGAIDRIYQALSAEGWQLLDHDCRDWKNGLF